MRCHVRVNSALPSPHAGETENISRWGVLVRLTSASAIGARLRQGDFVEASFELPARRDEMRRALYCRGKTVWWRVDGDDLLLGLAVDHMQFRDLPGIHGRGAAQEPLVM